MGGFLKAVKAGGRFGRISITPRRRTKILAMVANTDNAQFKKEPSAVTKLLTR